MAASSPLPEIQPLLLAPEPGPQHCTELQPAEAQRVGVSGDDVVANHFSIGQVATNSQVAQRCESAVGRCQLSGEEVPGLGFCDLHDEAGGCGLSEASANLVNAAAGFHPMQGAHGVDDSEPAANAAHLDTWLGTVAGVTGTGTAHPCFEVVELEDGWEGAMQPGVIYAAGPAKACVQPPLQQYPEQYLEQCVLLSSKDCAKCHSTAERFSDVSGMESTPMFGETSDHSLLATELSASWGRASAAGGKRERGRDVAMTPCPFPSALQPQKYPPATQKGSRSGVCRSSSSTWLQQKLQAVVERSRFFTSQLSRPRTKI